jgi:hypothetical protein
VLVKYYVFEDLHPRWIPHKVHRVTVNRWIDKGTFPPPDRISDNRLAWAETQLLRFEATRPPAGEPVPVLWPVRAMPKGRGQHRGKVAPGRIGRPVGSKVVGGRLIRPEDVPAALAAAGGGDDAD